MKKWLITGASGFLGVRTAVYYHDRFQVMACSHTELDVSDVVSVQRAFDRFRPEVVFHMAALSDTGFSEQHPDLSEQVNLQGTAVVAEACRQWGCKLVYMSSDQVYNGTAVSGPLPETAGLSPVNVYGRHKWQAEQKVRQILPDAVGLRLTWMYDLPDSPYRLNRNLLVNLKRAFEQGEPLRVATREIRGVTNVWEVVRRLEACLDLPGGVYNFGCENRLNSYELFLQTARLMGLVQPEQWILPDSERFPDHPRNLSMDTACIRSFGIEFPDTLQGIRQALVRVK